LGGNGGWGKNEDLEKKLKRDKNGPFNCLFKFSRKRAFPPYRLQGKSNVGGGEMHNLYP